ncbi:MAG TPA: helix-turn-helix transcriptional regulator [Chloroflexota bacterium]|nr:helix-turn-helix transcriptional regulator [Chloroflexota bacterium]
MQTLKEARAARLLTVRGLAQLAGVAPSTVYLIERGRSMPRFSVIGKIAAALDVKPGEIAEFAAAMNGIARGSKDRRRPDRSQDDGGLGNPRAGDTPDTKESGA